MKTCSRCVIDESFPGVVFDSSGICNYCSDYMVAMDKVQELSQVGFVTLKHEIQKSSRRKKYDVVLGLSGGLDSCYALALAVNKGLRVLAVHFDNGWNSNLSNSNIEKLVTALGVDLYTHVVDWNEYRMLQLSFFKADVVDIELLMDNGMIATLYKIAKKYGIKYIISGTNVSSEGVKFPPGWNWYKYDKKNIYAIAKIFGNIKPKTLWTISTLNYVYYAKILNIKWISILDYFDYDKSSAEEYLKAEYNYTPYEHKHGESVFTRFYQNYILPRKFKIDKRIPHLAALVASGQIERSAALSELSHQGYVDKGLLDDDMKYVCKKLGMTVADFIAYINRPPIPHDYYPSEVSIKNYLASLLRLLNGSQSQ